VSDDVPREDLEHGLRFAADTAMQLSHDTSRIETLLRAVVQMLVEARELDLDRFERNLQTPPAKRTDLVTIQLGKPIDRDSVQSPEIDCAALMPLCGARCCMLTFALSPQDLEDNRIAWSYRAPYQIAQGEDHRCVHQDRETGGCTVYEHRPAVCRSFDCRDDKRIWEDFENRIPAPLDAVLALRP